MAFLVIQNVAFLWDVVDYATSSDTSVAILWLDQEKAFDHVEWSFMQQRLLVMGFGPSFIGWVDLFYHGVRSSVNVNGYLSCYFLLSSGVLQGSWGPFAGPWVISEISV